MNNLRFWVPVVMSEARPPSEKIYYDVHQLKRQNGRFIQFVMFCNDVCSAGTVELLNLYNLHFTIIETTKNESSPCKFTFHLLYVSFLSQQQSSSNIFPKQKLKKNSWHNYMKKNYSKPSCKFSPKQIQPIIFVFIELQHQC